MRHRRRILFLALMCFAIAVALMITMVAKAGDPDRQAGVAYMNRSWTTYPALPVSWWYNYMPTTNPEHPGGAQYVQVIRLKDYVPSVALVQAAAKANPVSVWIIGNEPDEPTQDDMTPEEYAKAWHYWREIVRKVDPYAVFGFGPVADMANTAYLDEVIRAYRAQYDRDPLPDILVPHGYFNGTDVEQFADKARQFRQWMKLRGYQNRPLWITEYGVLGPAEEKDVIAFMEGTWDWMRTTRDPRTGYKPDKGRLVQRWAWFSGDCAQNIVPNATLFDPGSKGLTVYGKTWVNYWGRNAEKRR